MSLFLTGDDLGNIKSLRVSPGEPSQLSPLDSGGKSVAALSVCTASTSKSLAAAYADGTVSTFTFGDNNLQPLRQWRETRFKTGQRYVGLQATDKGVFSCTSNGALRMVGAEDEKQALGSLPTRLRDWRLSPDQKTLAYGGDEVDLSVWDTERAFGSANPSPHSGAAPSIESKRKRDALFPGEIWRAKNVPADGLGLRQGVSITSLTFLTPSTALPENRHLLTGTQFGDVRRYDTRSRRPVSNWKNIGKMGGVKVMKKGLAEHEVFVSDHGCNLFSLDLRNGRVIYSYKGLSGAVTSIAPSASLIVSTALDRYARVHTSFPPPLEAGQNQDNKGQVVEKVFMTSIPTVVVWDGVEPTSSAPKNEAEDDDVWDDMEYVEDDGDDDDDNEQRRKRRRNIVLNED